MLLPALVAVSPAAIGLSHFGAKQSSDPDQHYCLATVEIVMSAVKFKKESKSKAKVNEEVKEEVTVEDAEKEEVVLFKLSEEDIEFIYDNTHYTLKDINDWHR